MCPVHTANHSVLEAVIPVSQCMQGYARFVKCQQTAGAHIGAPSQDSCAPGTHLAGGSRIAARSMRTIYALPTSRIKGAGRWAVSLGSCEGQEQGHPVVRHALQAACRCACQRL